MCQNLREGRGHYLQRQQVSGFDLYFSFTGGPVLQELQSEFGAARAVPLYCSFDPEQYFPRGVYQRYRCDLSYMGTYAADRQAKLEELFSAAASHLPHMKFLLAGSQYPEGFAWKPNVHYVWHLTPAEHPSFYCSSALSLNVTRRPMAEMGYCPSGRLFEAAACGAAIVSDAWEGLDQFFEPGEEILIASSTDDTLNAFDLDPDERCAIGQRARERTSRTRRRRADVLDRSHRGHRRRLPRVRRRRQVRASSAIEHDVHVCMTNAHGGGAASAVSVAHQALACFEPWDASIAAAPARARDRKGNS